MKLIKALNEHLRLAGEPLGDFAREVKKLDSADKDRFVELFAELGIDIEKDW